jgi:hypothetical protein
MGEMADCRFTRQHPSGQVRYPPVSVDVARAALDRQQRWAERTAKSTGNVWATQDRAKQTKGRSHPCNARVIRMRSRTRQLELTTNYFLTISCTSFLQTLSLAGQLDPSCYSIRPKPSIHRHTKLPYSPKAARPCLLGPFSPLPTALLRSTDQCSPLVTILACITSTVHPS